MTRRMPPLNPLLVFEAAGRLGSFTFAAAELGVTQSAVSRQIGVLEGFVGCRLFHRGPNGVALTPVGRAYQAEIGPALGRIAAATETLWREQQAEPVRLRVYATFAVKWLLGRLPRFQAEHPEIEVALSTATKPVDFENESVDLAVQFGAGDWPGAESRKLLPDFIQPVCSPRLVPASPPLAGLDDLARFRLLHSRYRSRDWRDWLEAMGRPDLLHAGMRFPSSVLTFQAAADGLGVAMGQITLLKDDLEAGRLVGLFTPLERPLGHYLVWPANRPLARKTRAVLGWLQREAAAVERAAGGLAA